MLDDSKDKELQILERKGGTVTHCGFKFAQLVHLDFDGDLEERPSYSVRMTPAHATLFVGPEELRWLADELEKASEHGIDYAPDAVKYQEADRALFMKIQAMDTDPEIN